MLPALNGPHCKGKPFPLETRRNVGTLLGQRHVRWPDIVPKLNETYVMKIMSRIRDPRYDAVVIFLAKGKQSSDD